MRKKMKPLIEIIDTTGEPNIIQEMGNAENTEPEQMTTREKLETIFGEIKPSQHIQEDIQKRANMEKKKTAVEWFIEKTIESGHLCVTDTPSDMTELGKLIERAKEIEKQQIVNAYNNGFEDDVCCRSWNEGGHLYYRKNYEKKKDKLETPEKK